MPTQNKYNSKLVTKRWKKLPPKGTPSAIAMPNGPATRREFITSLLPKMNESKTNKLAKPASATGRPRISKPKKLAKSRRGVAGRLSAIKLLSTETTQTSRRKFLATVGMAAAAATILPRLAADWTDTLPTSYGQELWSGDWSTAAHATGSWWESTAFADARAAAAAAAPRKPFTMSMMNKASNWCWARIASSVGRYFGTSSLDPCQLANQIFGYTNCCTPSGTAPPSLCNQIFPFNLGLWAVNANTQPAKPSWFGSLSFPLTAKALAALPLAPVVPSISWTQLTTAVAGVSPAPVLMVLSAGLGAGPVAPNHAIVIKDVNGTTNSFRIEDPAVGPTDINPTTIPGGASAFWPYILSYFGSMGAGVKWNGAWFVTP